MPRSRGPNSKMCNYCAVKGNENRVIDRLGKVYQYDTYNGMLGSHTCRHMNDEGNISSGYKMGRFVAAAATQTSELTELHCPDCQAVMVLRTAERGHNKGSQFWGCSRYRFGCRGTRQVEGQPAPDAVETEPVVTATVTTNGHDNGSNGSTNGHDNGTVETFTLDPLKVAADFGQYGKAVETMSDIATLTVKTLRNISTGTVATSIEAAKNAAREMAAELFPVEHRVVVTTDGTERTVDGKTHPVLEDVVAIIAQDIPVMMVGPAGGGKTSLARQVAQALGLRFFEKALGPQTSEWNLVGVVNPTSGQYIPGCLREPFENGGLLALDEIDAANAGILVTLNSALSNGHYTFPDGVEVTRHPDFRCIASGNTYGKGEDRIYVGRNQLDGATINRFAGVDVDYDEVAELDWAGHDQKPWVEYVQRVRRAAENHQMRVIISPRASINGAKLLRAGMAIEKVAKATIFFGMSKDDKERLLSIAPVPSY